LSGSEKILGLIQDVLLPVDSNTRYDIYFTDCRIAIVCMGHSDRYEYGRTYSSLTFIAPTTSSVDREKQERINKTILEDEVSKLSMDEKLNLSKKSCYYTYKEIEEVRLVLGKQSKFIILSEDCESKFALTPDQQKQLGNLLPTIEPLKDKLSEAGSWSILHQKSDSEGLSCGFCGFENDADAVFCQCCGKKIEPNATLPPELTCAACGTKNRPPAAYCKNCGTSMQAENEDAS
jgi:hypothetical protein